MELKGKKLSQFAKIIAACIVILALIANAIGHMVRYGYVVPIDDAIKAALFIALIFAPIDISIWLDIFTGWLPRKTIPADGKDEDENAKPEIGFKEGN